MNCRNGQSVPIAIDGKGKYHVVEGQTDHSPNAFQPAPQGMTTDTKKAIAAYVEEMGALYGFCYQTATIKLSDAPNEAKQAMASSLFIAAQRKFGLA